MDNKAPLGNEGTTELETKEQPTPEQVQHEHEKQMFKTHVETSGEKIPAPVEEPLTNEL